jgi:hypothetical protein
MRYTEEDLRKAVADSLSIRQVLSKLGLVEAGGNYSTIKAKIKALELDISHFTGRAWRRGTQIPVVAAQSLKEILVENSTFKTAYHLKNRLFREDVKQRQCENCGLTEWQTKPIPLELHHVNGCKTDNRLKNLEILCPNCHAFTDTYRAKNSKKV